MHITALPTETLLDICRLLGDKDLLVLCQTSRLFNDLALTIFFSRHGISQSNIQDGTVNITSASLPGIRLALSFTCSQKLSCTFKHANTTSDLSTLTRLVSRLPPMRELEIEVNHQLSRRNIGADNPFLDLLFAFIPDKVGTLVILDHDSISVSRPRRVYRQLGDYLPVIRYSNIYLALAAMCICRLSKKIFDLYAIVRDPLIRARQFDRVREDLRYCSPSTSLRITRQFLPILSNWTLVAVDQNSITCLSIPSTTFLRSKLPSILPAITLPALKYLIIDNNAQLPFPSFVDFLRRHPLLKALTLEDFSVTYHSLAPLPPDSLIHLQYLKASPRHVINILRDSKSAAGDGGWRNMAVVGFPPIQHRLNRARIEPYGFDELDEALLVVADYGAMLNLSLCIRFPGGTTSRAWFDSVRDQEGREGERPERRMYNVSSMQVGTERDIPLCPEVISLLPTWLALFPNLERVGLARWLVQTKGAWDKLASDVRRECPVLDQVHLIL